MELEINDKRRFDENGDAQEVPHTLREQINQIMLAEANRVYDDAEPMSNHCLVKQGETETVYKGTRFVIPEVAQQNPNEGVVVAVGPEIAPERLQPGDLIVFGRFNAEPIDVDGDTYQLVNFNDIKLRKRVTYAIGQN